MPQQVVINGVEFARRSEQLAGDVPLSALARLSDVVVAAEGGVAYSLAGSLGARGEALLRLRASGVLPVQCQRCMERYDHVLVLDVVFEMLAADAELTQEEVEDDSRDYLPADDEIDVLALVEDEIILSLPVAPRHEDCPVPLPRSKGEDDSPFASLVTLKQKMH